MEFSAVEKDAICKLRSTVAAEDCVSDYELSRWLAARHWNVDKAKKMYVRHQQWRKDWDVDGIWEWEAPEVLKKYFTFGKIGISRDGYPVWMFAVGRCDIKGILRTVSSQEVLKYSIYILEKTMVDMKQQAEMLRKPVTHQCHIFDLDHFNLKQITNKPVLDVLIRMVELHEANYPETLKRAIVINAPKSFSVFYSIAKPLLDDVTVKKVSIYGKTGWRDELLKEVTEEVLPVHWGGGRVDPTGDPFCSSEICLGGKVPKHYYSKKKQVFKEEDSKDGPEHPGTTCRVSLISGSKHITKVEVNQARSEVRWSIRPEKGDVVFAITLTVPEGSEEEFVPPMTVRSGREELGFLICPQAGTLSVEVACIPEGEDQFCEISCTVHPPSS